jgi:hypothetical protein
VVLAKEVPQERPFRDPSARQTRIAPPAAPGSSKTNENGGRFELTPHYASVNNARLLMYPTSSDTPRWNSEEDFDGNGVALPNATFPRNKYAVGIQTNGMSGGGCVALDPANNPTGNCLQLVNASGQPYQPQAQRQRWTFRIAYIDPATPGATEVNIGFIGGFSSGNSGDWSVEWVARTTGGHECFTFYPCDYYGLDLHYLTGTASWSLPDCLMKLGPGYTAYIYYQSSPYLIDAVPTGAQEWYPDTVAATPARLEKPGAVLWSRSYSLGRSDNALSVGGPGVIHPQVDATGYSGANDPLNLGISSIAAGTGTVTVTSYDCGVIPNVAFTIEKEFLESGGHAHSSTSPPSDDDVNKLETLSASTDANGRKELRVTAGTVAGTMKYTATAQNLLGSPFTAQPLFVTTGFVNMIDPGPDFNTRYTGQTVSHPVNHYGPVEMHFFLRDLAQEYNERVADPALQGSLGLNDMSLRMGGIFDLHGDYKRPHRQHSFGVACDIDHFVRRFTDNQFIAIDYEDILFNAASDLGGFLLIESNNNDNLHVQLPESMISDVLLRQTR